MVYLIMKLELTGTSALFAMFLVPDALIKKEKKNPESHFHRIKDLRV